MGPFPRTSDGSCYVVTFTDNYSRFNVSAALPDATAASLRRAFDERWLSVFGPPRRLLTDNGPQYTGGTFETLLHQHGILHSRTTTYNPQGDGVAERLNRTLMAVLKKVCEDTEDWPTKLLVAVYSHNATVSSTTGETPFQLMLGRPPPTVVELPVSFETRLAAKVAADNRAKDLLKKAAAERGEHNAVTPSPFALGDIVLLHDPVVPPGPGQRRLKKPFGHLSMVVGLQLPNVALIRAHPGGGPTVKVSMRRLKLAPPNLQPGYVPPLAPPLAQRKSNLPNKHLPLATPSEPATTTKSGRVVRPSVRFA
jgi:transposase InsO family protein